MSSEQQRIENREQRCSRAIENREKSISRAIENREKRRSRAVNKTMLCKIKIKLFYEYNELSFVDIRLQGFVQFVDGLKNGYCLSSRYNYSTQSLYSNPWLPRRPR